jgi:hypothetical protein
MEVRNMSVNLPAHPWTSSRSQRSTRLILLTCLIVGLLFALLLAPAFQSHPLPTLQTTPVRSAPAFVLNPSCSPFAALGGCLVFTAPAA